MRFLIVEDERGSRLLLVHMLKGVAECDEAADGEEAIECFKRALEANKPYDLVFLDIMMPKKSGQEVLAEMRDLEQAAGIPAPEGVKVLMTTALDDEENIFDAHVSGCSGYLVKPIRREIVLSEIEKLDLGQKAKA